MVALRADDTRGKRATPKHIAWIQFQIVYTGGHDDIDDSCDCLLVLKADSTVPSGGGSWLLAQTKIHHLLTSAP